MALFSPFMPAVQAPPPPPFNAYGRAFDAASTPLLPEASIRALIDGVAYPNPSAVYDVGGSFSFRTRASTEPVVSFTLPAGPETWTVGETRILGWTIADETPTSDMIVWLNYSYATGSGTLVAAEAGRTSFTWRVPPTLAGSTVTFRLEAVDADGSKGMATSAPVSILASAPPASDPVPWIVGAGTLAAFAAALLLVARALRRMAVRMERVERGPTAGPRPSRPEELPEPEPPAAATTRRCPSCGTIVDLEDPECFYCGHRL